MKRGRGETGTAFIIKKRRGKVRGVWGANCKAKGWQLAKKTGASSYKVYIIHEYENKTLVVIISLVKAEVYIF